MDNWKVWLENLKAKPYSALGLLILLALPVTLLLVFRSQDTRSRASAPDKLEVELGTPNSNAVKVSDNTASGNQYVRLNTASTPTLTSAPNPTIPPNAVYIPSSIDSTGTTDVQQQLNDFIKNTPDGSTIVFKKSGIYSISRLIWMRGRKNITLEGNGATFKLIGNDTPHWNSGFHIDYFSENITARNFMIIGNHAAAGTPSTCCSREAQSGFKISASKNVLIENVNISRVGGDCFTISSSYQETAPNDGITIRNNTCTLTGRMGMHTINSNNVLFENNYFNQIGYAVFSSEPNESFEDVNNLTIKNNTIGTYSLNDSYVGALYYYSDAWWSDGPTDMSGITITGNTVEGNINGKTGKMMGLDVKIYENGTGLREKVTVTNNTAKKTVPGPVMTFESVKGVTVTGNSQPLSSGSLVSSPRCTNVTIQNNQ